MNEIKFIIYINNYYIIEGFVLLFLLLVVVVVIVFGIGVVIIVVKMAVEEVAVVEM